jgi:hypothetical protein
MCPALAAMVNKKERPNNANNRELKKIVTILQLYTAFTRKKNNEEVDTMATMMIPPPVYKMAVQLSTCAALRKINADICATCHVPTFENKTVEAEP